MLCALLGRHSRSSWDASCQRRQTGLEANCWWRSRASMHVQISTEGFVRRVPWLSLLWSDSGNSSIRTVEPRYGIFTTDCVTSKRGGRPGATQRWRVAKRKLRPTHMAAFNQIWFMGRRDFCWNLPKSGKDQKSGRTGQSKRPHAAWRRVLRRTQARGVRNESLVARAKNARSPCIVGWKFTYSRASRSRGRTWPRPSPLAQFSPAPLGRWLPTRYSCAGAAGRPMGASRLRSCDRCR